LMIFGLTKCVLKGGVRAICKTFEHFWNRRLIKVATVCRFVARLTSGMSARLYIYIYIYIYVLEGSRFS
jgi:hypothetical protein